MLHELSDGPGVPVRRCARCAAILVSSSECPSHRDEELQEQLRALEGHRAPIAPRALLALQARQEIRICDLARLLDEEPHAVAKALRRLALRGLVHRTGAGTWTVGRPPTGDAIVLTAGPPSPEAWIALARAGRRAA